MVSAQASMNVRLNRLEQTTSRLQFDQDVLMNDMASMSFQHEQCESQLSSVEKQLENIEAEKLKNSRRIFGLEESESNESELKALIKEKVFNVAGNDFEEYSILTAWRIGEKGMSYSKRMAIAKLTRHVHKYKLFHYRENLRAVEFQMRLPSYKGNN